MARDDPYFRLRIPEELKEAIAESADANHRSMTAEIISRLEWSFNPAGGAKIVTIEGQNMPVQVLADAFAESFRRHFDESFEKQLKTARKRRPGSN